MFSTPAAFQDGKCSFPLKTSRKCIPISPDQKQALRILPELARAKIKSIAALDRCTILPVTRTVVEKSLELCELHEVSRQRYFDFQLVALMLLEGIPTIVTENEKDFASIPGITIINPFD